MKSKLRWGILGCGGIAPRVRPRFGGVAHRHAGRGPAAVRRKRRRRFAQECGAAVAHASYEALLADPAVQAIYIATPHPHHAEWTVKAAEAGKHVLARSRSASTPPKRSDDRGARRHDVFLMEAFMYRCHPRPPRWWNWVRDGAIGEVRHIQADSAFNAGFNPDSRFVQQRFWRAAAFWTWEATRFVRASDPGAAAGKEFPGPGDGERSVHPRQDGRG